MHEIKFRDVIDISQPNKVKKPKLHKPKRSVQPVLSSFSPQQFLPTGIQKPVSA